eukprot:7077788-Prymnesium_polylepis.1
MVDGFECPDCPDCPDCAQVRSIPSMVDGLKPGQRKILYCCFKRGKSMIKNEIKVAQLAGYVSEHSAYHRESAPRPPRAPSHPTCATPDPATWPGHVGRPHHVTLLVCRRRPLGCQSASAPLVTPSAATCASRVAPLGHTRLPRHPS